MDYISAALIVAIMAITLLYVWIIWTAIRNGRSGLLWFVLTFIISPWLVALLLLCAGETSTHKELRELRRDVNPEVEIQRQREQDKDDLSRRIFGIVSLILHVIFFIILFSAPS